MCPPVASPAVDIGVYCSDKEIFTSLDGIICGSPLPSNVISDVNPYEHKPSDLPEGIWFFIRSKMRKDADFGYWRTKGEACQIFSDSSITGWRSTLEFYEGQAPLGNKTDWVMQEYWITRKILSMDCNAKETSLLCNVFFVGGQKPNHEKPQKVAQVDTASKSTQSVFQKAGNYAEQGSTSGRQIHQGDSIQFIAMHEDDGTGRMRSRERVPDNLVDIDHVTDYPSEGDYLELMDLENPASPSSSSDSSCLSMSSGEYFDVLDLLRDLESEQTRERGQNNSGCKFSVFATSKPNEMVIYPASIETLDKSPNEEMLGDAKKNPDRNPKSDFRNEGTPSTSQNRFASHSGDVAAPEEDRKAARGRTRKPKKKYLCFLPF